LRLHAYKIQLKQEIKPDDRPKRVEFATFMLNAIDEDEIFLQRICFSDEATFYVNGCVYRHNCRIWGTQQPNEIHEYVRGSPKVNVWCGLLYDRVIGPFFFSESTITGVVYLDLLEQYVFPQIETFEQESVSRVISMQDGAPPHFSCFVTDVLNERSPDAWIGRGGPIPWPPRSLDLSPLGFFLWGYINPLNAELNPICHLLALLGAHHILHVSRIRVKNIVYAEKIRNIQHLQERITSAIETVTRGMIQKTWQEIEFRLDVSRATNGAHIEMY